MAADAYGECKDLDGARITTENECKQACNSLKIKNVYQVGQWGHSPGCFYYGGNRNCHWNTRTNVSWSAGDHFAVCRHKLNNGKYNITTLLVETLSQCKGYDGVTVNINVDLDTAVILSYSPTSHPDGT